MYRIRKLKRFEAAHRLRNSYSKQCHNLHGHSYELEIFLCAPSIDQSTGMVMDFGLLNKKIDFLVSLYDHTVLVARDDKILQDFLISQDSKLVLINGETTCENMSKQLFEEIECCLEGELNVRLDKIVLHETRSGYAEYSRF